MDHFSEIEELNKVIINSKDLLEWQNDPDSISNKIPESLEVIEMLKNELNLSEIEIHKKIDGLENNLGISYRFGNSKNETQINYLIFAENKNNLDSYRGYEQFIDCGKSDDVNQNWAFNTIDLNCYD